MAPLHSLALISFLTLTSAHAAGTQPASFEQLKLDRQTFNQKVIELEGRVKDLKLIREDGNQFATFFLTASDQPEMSTSVKVQLKKRKTVINLFQCIDGNYTTVQGRFKAWGTGSYFGKIEVNEPYKFSCSETAPKRKEAVKPAAPAVAVDEAELPTIAQVSGGGEAEISGNGKKTSVKIGTKLAPGTTLTTNGQTAVQVKYPDGSKLVVGKQSKLKTQAAGQDARTIELVEGRLHALIKKSPGSRIHFKVKTRAATMGVRGTQFFVSSTADGKVSTHVLDGRVDVAKSEQELDAGKVRTASREESIEASPAGISDARHFEVKEFLAEVRKEQPALLEVESAENAISPEAPVATPTPAATPVPAREETRAAIGTVNRLLSFRVVGLRYPELNGAAREDGLLVSWNPRLAFANDWSWGLDLGFGNVNSTLEYAAAVSYALHPDWKIEVRGGAQSMLQSPKQTGWIAGGALEWVFFPEAALHSLLIGCDALTLSGQTVALPRVAIGFQF